MDCNRFAVELGFLPSPYVERAYQAWRDQDHAELGRIICIYMNTQAFDADRKARA